MPLDPETEAAADQVYSLVHDICRSLSDNMVDPSVIAAGLGRLWIEIVTDVYSPADRVVLVEQLSKRLL